MAAPKPTLKAAVFDLDGVITRTAAVHEQAWKALFDEYLRARATRLGEPFRPFEREDYHRYVDGRPRYAGVRTFLASRGIMLPEGDPLDAPDADTITGLGNRKNDFFRKLLEAGGVQTYPAAVRLVEALRRAGLRVAIATSSRNGREVLQRSGTADLFEAVVDGNVSLELALKGKPAPDIFVEAARRVGATPRESLVFEDAVSGVAAGRNGQFGLVVGVDRAGQRDALLEAGADLVIEDFNELDVEKLSLWMEGKDSLPPHALAEWDGLEARMRGRRPAVFLDYDGTLTPIVSRPELAVIDDDMRVMLRRLAAFTPTVIVSGRARADVAALVGLDDLYYAGSHGFDISGPRGSSLRHAAGDDYVDDIAEAYAGLVDTVNGIEGALIENKRYALAVHFRNVDDARVSALDAAIAEVVAANPRLRRTGGKKIFEIRPAIEWHKGKALLWLLDALELGADHVPVYLGDDETDEDAFRAIAEDGLPIAVIDTPRETDACWYVRDVNEVRMVLERLLETIERAA